MGGREASSTYYKLGGEGHVYGDEYKSAIHGFDNVKIVAMTKNTSLKAPQESKTPGRIYATINRRPESFIPCRTWEATGNVTSRLTLAIIRA